VDLLNAMHVKEMKQFLKKSKEREVKSYEFKVQNL
jgi:hypothetical protein